MTRSENARGTIYWWVHGDIVDFLWGKWSPGHPDFTNHRGSAPATVSIVPDWPILAPHGLCCPGTQGWGPNCGHKSLWAGGAPQCPWLDP